VVSKRKETRKTTSHVKLIKKALFSVKSVSLLSKRDDAEGVRVENNSTQNASSLHRSKVADDATSHSVIKELTANTSFLFRFVSSCVLVVEYGFHVTNLMMAGIL